MIDKTLDTAVTEEMSVTKWDIIKTGLQIGEVFMYSKDLDELLKKNKKLIDEIYTLDNSNFNIFHVLGCSRYEVRHSSFLAWLLKNEVFLRKFAKACGIELEESSLKSINVETEEAYRVKDITDNIDSEKFKGIVLKPYEENNKNRYIDINIKGVDFSLTIENKVDSGEHDDQCISYYNYMMIDPYKRYKEAKTKYFVFLAKEKPDHYELLGGLAALDKCKTAKEYEAGMKYFNYRLITYSKILDILKDFSLENPIENEILEQYKLVLSEWEKLGEEYKELISKIDQEDLLQIEDKYNTWRNNDENSKEMRFLDVAYQYYKQEKKSFDDKIKPALDRILSNDITVKTGYGRGSYANAIPLELNILDEHEIADYCINYSKKEDFETATNIAKLYEQTKKLGADQKRIENSIKRKEQKIKKLENRLKNAKDEQEKSIILWNKNELESEIYKDKNDELEKIKKKLHETKKKLVSEKEKVLASNKLNKIQKPMLQTVDFRSPMLDKDKKYSMAFLAGFKSDYSKELCKYIINGELEKSSVYNEIASNRNYTLTFSYSFGNGTGYGDKESFECDINSFFKYCKAKDIKGTDDDVKKLYIKKLSFEEMFIDNAFTDFLKELKDNEVMTSEELNRLIEKAFDYFLNKEKISQSYENLKDEQEYYEDPDKYSAVEKNILKILPEFDIDSYKSRIKKKIGIEKTSKKGKDTTNKQLNFVWQLCLSYSIDEESPSEDELVKVYYDETKRGLSLFGYDEQCKRLLKPNGSL